MGKRRIVRNLLLVGIVIVFCSAFSFHIRAEVNYNADAAVTYAKNHWDDGVGVCDQFVKACLDAGGIHITVGIVTNVYNALLDYGTSYQLTTRGEECYEADNLGKVAKGDILFWYCSKCGKFMHTGIISSIGKPDGIIHYAAHNGAVFDGHNIATYGDSKGHSGSCITCYVIHLAGIQYNEKPTFSIVTTDRNSYQVGEDVTFTITSDKATHYWVGIDDQDGNRIDTHETYVPAYTRSFPAPGQYSCYVSSVNDCGYTDSERIYFTVYDESPAIAVLNVNETNLRVGDTACFTFHADQPCEFVLHIEKGGYEIEGVHTSDNSLLYTFIEEGSYDVWIGAGNSIGSCASNVIMINVLPDMDEPDFILPLSTTTIEVAAFEGNSMSVAYIPDTCTSIGAYAFKSCKKLTQIRIPEKCTISDTAFVGCGTVYIFSHTGSSVEGYCQNHDNCIFVEE